MANTLRGQTITVVEKLVYVVELCIRCGIPMAVEQEYQRERRRDHRYFYCLNGHSQAYMGKNAEETLRAELAERDALIARKNQERDGLLDQIRVVERSRAAVQGELTKVKKRVRAGVCPECNRTFQRLSDHMRSKHSTSADTQAVAHEHGAPPSSLPTTGAR